MFAAIDPVSSAALIEGENQGRATVDALAGGSNTQEVWSTAKHMFDYNLDRHGLGTIDSPEWKIADRTKAYLTRAVIARAGLWGTTATRRTTTSPGPIVDGAPLDGLSAYEVTFAPPPPAEAFWSLTMYDTPRFYLVDNPIDRYSIGDRTRGLRYDDEGSVTLYLQHDAPGDQRDSNWLPTPAGAFRPVLRTYQPGPAILDNSYTLPDIRNVG